MAIDEVKYVPLDRWKYWLERDFRYGSSIDLEEPAIGAGGLVRLSVTGILSISRGYMWDGDSGPAIDSPASMRASLVHDALYQLLSEGQIPREQRHRADAAYVEILIEDGFPSWMARLRLVVLTLFGGVASRRRDRRRARLAKRHSG